MGVHKASSLKPLPFAIVPLAYAYTVVQRSEYGFLGQVIDSYDTPTHTQMSALFLI